MWLGSGAELLKPLSPTFGPCSKLSMACAEALESGVWPLQASQVALVMKNLLATTEDLRDMGSIPGLGRSPGGRHGKTLQSVFLPGESPWTEEPGGLQSMGCQRVGHD